MLDIGACYGDSSIVFLQYNPEKIYAYEPNPENYDYLLKTIKMNNASSIVPVKKGMGDIATNANISIDGGCSSVNETKFTKRISEIEIDTIDNQCKGQNVGLIKMDVEGFEYNVIKGGLETIKRDCPILLISIYHSGKDFFEIMPMLRSQCPGYKFKFFDTAPHSAIAEKMIVAYVE